VELADVILAREQSYAYRGKARNGQRRSRDVLHCSNLSPIPDTAFHAQTGTMIPWPGQNYLCGQGPIGSKVGLSHDSGPGWGFAPGPQCGAMGLLAAIPNPTAEDVCRFPMRSMGHRARKSMYNVTSTRKPHLRQTICAHDNFERRTSVSAAREENCGRADLGLDKERIKALRRPSSSEGGWL
jgi:hypothetical protein